MKQGYLSQYFEKIAYKILGAVETRYEVSHQHEFNGIKQIRDMLGEPSEKTTYPAKFLFLSDDNENEIVDDGILTWYDARKNHPIRTEWRLYYSPNVPMQLAEEGDILFIAKPVDSDILLVIISEKGSTISSQLQWLFGIGNSLSSSFSVRVDLDTEHDKINFATRFILEQIGIKIDESDDNYLEIMLNRFNNKFPTSLEFSSFSRATLSDINCLESPDFALTAWMEREEILFRTLEKHIVGMQLNELIAKRENLHDIESFLNLAMSTFQRRKARAGAALENHLEEIFKIFNISYTRNGITEQKHKPDFIFPGIKQYHDKNFSPSSLTMLGAKSSCKERWRQILTEADRISIKHLLTLEPGISESQTKEMVKQNVCLVIPSSIQSSYSPKQLTNIINVNQFIEFLASKGN